MSCTLIFLDECLRLHRRVDFFSSYLFFSFPPPLAMPGGDHLPRFWQNEDFGNPDEGKTPEKPQSEEYQFFHVIISCLSGQRP